MPFLCIRLIICVYIVASSNQFDCNSLYYTNYFELDVSGKVKLMQDKVEEVVGDRLTTTTSLKPLSAVTNTNTAAVIQTDVAVSTSDATASSGKISVSVSEPIAASSTAVVAVANTLKEEKVSRNNLTGSLNITYSPIYRQCLWYTIVK